MERIGVRSKLKISDLLVRNQISFKCSNACSRVDSKRREFLVASSSLEVDLPRDGSINSAFGELLKGSVYAVSHSPKRNCS